MLLNWPTDQRTEEAATEHPILFDGQLSDEQRPALQFRGCRTSAKIWDDRVIKREWPPDQLCSSPDQIISFFRKRHYTQGLAMVVSWGGMGRTSKAIYGPKNSDGKREIETIKQIDETLHNCAGLIQESQSIADSWEKLISMKNVHWSAVITSKTLHFLCRAAGFTQNPPVAVDNKIIRERLWPAFR